MSNQPSCPKCGAALLDDSPEPRCPRCRPADGLELPTSAHPAEVSQQTTIASTSLPHAPSVLVRYFGDYELLEELARGGMGVVYRARQISLNRIVAVKLILSGHFATEAEVKRFQTEAEAAANLQHPNIVAIHEVGVHEGRRYFSMDYVQGKNLAQLLDARSLLPTVAARYVRTIAEAIHFAHQRGILHRDLKPQNVLIDWADQPRITDFGLAKRLDQDESLTRSGTILGSPNYMAPEQAAGRLDRVGPHSDVYSLGAILYQLLTGEPPFRGETAMATLAKVQEEEPVPPTRLNRQIPFELETICLKCLSKEPGRRYHSARALAEDLDRLLNEQPILARPPSRSRKTLLWFKRRPWVLMGTILSFSLGLIWLAYALWVENRALIWENLRPGEVRPADWGTRQFSDLRPVLFVYLFITFQHWWTRPFEKQRRQRILSGKRIHGGLLCAHGLFSLAILALGIYVGMKAIEFYSWDNQAAIQLQRDFEHQKWQELKKLHPDWPLPEPNATGFTPVALGLCLLSAFAGAWSGVSLLRKVVKEYLFVMFRSADEERRERENALWTWKSQDTKIFGVHRAKPKIVLLTAKVCAGLSVIIVTAFAIVESSGSAWSMELVLPTAAVLSGAFTVALIMTTLRQNRSWLTAKLLVLILAVTGIVYLLRHYEYGLTLLGAAGGILYGIVLAIPLKKILRRQQKIILGGGGGVSPGES